MLARTLSLAGTLAMVSAGCGAAPETQSELVAGPAATSGTRSALARVGLMTSLPLYWGEADGVGELLQGMQQPGWVRETLETRFVLDPLDTLDEATLAGHDQIILAQPRALSPAENVALDAWVRGGGRLLLLADPMLTRESRFAIGDKRRPQDVILLSPILSHWGLALAFDPDLPEAERVIEVDGIARVPVARPGVLSLLPGGPCRLAAEGIMAHCAIGKGRVTMLADAAIVDDAADDGAERRRKALLALAGIAFD